MIDISDSIPIHPTKKPRVRIIDPFNSDIKMIVIHTTNTISDITAIAKYHTSPGNHISSTGCPRYAYHDTIKEDGNIYHCVPYSEETWHAGKFNFESIAVALNYVAEAKIGKSKNHYSPNDKMLQSLYKHLGTLCFQKCLSPKSIYGHRELKGTGWFWNKGSKVLRKSCPGLRVILPIVRIQATKVLQLTLKANGLYQNGRIDGIAGPKTTSALKTYHFKRITK